MIKVQIKLFAAARERVGSGTLTWSLPDPATVQGLQNTLFQTYPELEAMRLRFAVNATYVGTDAPLHDGDEVALIPPVGGG